MRKLEVSVEVTSKSFITRHTSTVVQLPNQLELAELRAIIDRETDRLELKTGAGQGPLSAAMVAFSNTDGGTILIGVTDDRRVVGRRLDQGMDDRIHRAALVAHDLGRYSVRELTVGGTTIVAVEVHRREEGFAQTSDGRVLVRRGSTNVNLLGDELWTFMSQRRLRRFESTSSGLALSQIDPTLEQAVCDAQGWSPNDNTLEDRLRERGLAAEGNLTVAGALFLTHPANSMSLRKAEVEVRRYQDAGTDYDRRVEFGGSLADQVREATQFVVDELGNDLVVSGVHRYELPKLPSVVIREAIANAVAHRSYEEDRTNVLVQMRPDRVVVTSPGLLPEPVTIATMRQAQAARNPIIIDVLRKFHLAEDAGRGVDVMEDSMEAALLDPPQFDEVGRSVVVTLPLHGPITARERGWVTDLERRGELQSGDRRLLVHAARGERLTNAAAREILSADAQRARQALHRLRDHGFLVQSGRRGGANYALSEEIAPAARYRLSPEQLDDLVVEEAKSRPLSNETVRDLTGLGREDALAVLRRLVANNRLRTVGRKRGTRYHIVG
jgi:ATP-dependent DNA helicase RecG